jgi:hypothetical protein
MHEHLTINDFHYCLKIFQTQDRSAGDGSHTTEHSNVINADDDHFETQFYKIPSLK